MISLNKCTGSSNVLFPKTFILKETKGINVKAFNMITNKNEAKARTEQILCDCKCKFNSTTCNSKTCIWNPSTCICENSMYLKSIADTSVTEFDEFIIFMDNVSIKKTNTIATKTTNTLATNVASTASINCHSKKVRDCYILRTVLLVIILLWIIATIYYHYAKRKGII